MLGLILCLVPCADLQAADFSKLAEANPLVLVGAMQPVPRAAEVATAPSGPLAHITVQTVLKQDGRYVILEEGDKVVLGATEPNKSWAGSKITYAAHQTGMWVLKWLDAPKEHAQVVAHFIIDKSSVDGFAEQVEAAKKKKPVLLAGEYSWGIANCSVSIYTGKGKFIKKLPAGSLVEVSEFKSTDSVDFAVCAIEEGGNLSRDKVIMKADHLDIRPGSLKNANGLEKQLRVQLGKLKGELAKEAGPEEKKEKNPHSADYIAARKKQAAYEKRVAELTKKRDVAKGSAQLHYAGQLRKVQVYQRPIAEQMAAVTSKHEKWEMENKKPEVKKAVAVTPRMKELRQEISALREELSRIY